MREHNFRTRIVSGTFTLPVAAVLTAVMWLFSGVTDSRAWAGLAVLGLIAYLLVELNNRNALLRVRSRMVSTVFLGLAAASPFFHVWDTAMMPSLALVAAYFPLFAAYQRRNAAGQVFHSSLFIGVGSLFYPPLLLLLAVLLFCLAVHLRALDWRSCLALLFGGLLPWYGLLAYGVWNGSLCALFSPYLAAFCFSGPDYSALSLPEMMMEGFVVLSSLAAMVHFFRTAYNDKIRTRMYFYVIIAVEIVLLAALFAQPQRSDVLLRLLIVNSSPLIGHHISLGKGRWVNVWFAVCLVSLIGLLVFNVLYIYADGR